MRIFSTVLLLSVSLSAQAHYRHNGAALENDLSVTPGAARTTDVKLICNTRTGTVRDVTHATKRKVYALYGLNCGATCYKRYEVDHSVSLEIGGTNDLANLWPQPYAQPGARQKDVLENLFHKMICDGEITPTEAQHEISTDWYAAYKRYVRPADVKLGR